MATFIRSACLQGYVELARSAGLDPFELFEECGIHRAWLNDPDIRFAVASFRELVQRSAQRSGWPDFGLRLARTRTLSGLGPLALLVREQPTSRRAIQAIVANIRLHVESLDLQFEELGAQTVLRLEPGESSRHLRSPLVELTLGSLHRVIEHLLPGCVRPLSVKFMHGPPPCPDAYRHFFGAPVQFLADQDALLYSSTVLDIPRPSDATLETYARRWIDELAKRPASGIVQEVRALIATLLPAGRCSLQHISDLLALHERTLRRRLAREGASYEQLLAQVRENLALQYVSTTDRHFTDIAVQLGFSSGSQFAHWFRASFGCSASQWRSEQDRAHTQGIHHNIDH